MKSNHLGQGEFLRGNCFLAGVISGGTCLQGVISLEAQDI